MKRFVSALLAFLLLLLCFVSCAEQGESTDDSDTDISVETSAETSDDEALTGEKRETVVSISKPYTTSYKPGEGYPDTHGTELCDGIYASEGASYTDAGFSGWLCSNGVLSVTFDMGEDSKRLYKFGVSYYAIKVDGIGPLSSGHVYLSDDGENWTRTSAFTLPAYEAVTTQQAWITLETPVDARYVRFDLKGSNAWLFLDELTVIADVSGSSLHANYLEQLDAAYNGNHISESDLKTGHTSVSRELELINATQGKSYRTNRPAVKTFPDSGRLLTNGNETGAGYESGAFVGYEGGEALTIDIDLGKTVEGLSDFALAMYQQAGLRQMLPYYVDFYISEDGKTYDKIGRVYAPNDLTVTNFTFELHFAKGFSARSVRFELSASDSTLFLIEEASACYYGTTVSDPLYPPLELPEVTETFYRPNPSSRVTNLVAGLPYQITSQTELRYADEIDANTLASAGVLTDGKYSPSLTFNNGYWNRTRNGNARNVYFDLGYNSSVTGFKINYLQYRPYAILAPAVTDLYLSEDGVIWYSAGAANCSTLEDTGTVTAELTLEVPREARFVCVSFANAPHTYADEIEVYGTQAITGRTRKLDELERAYPDAPKRFMPPSENILEGVADLALLYYNRVIWDEEHILPYVAYLDADGNIRDTLFDGLLFLPSGAMPSGGLAHEAGADNPTVLSDWLYQFEQDFKEGRHFDAADKVTARVKEELHLPADYKVKVYATIFYPHLTATNFGDIDGDGVSEDFSKAEDRIKAISCYMDMYLARFAEEGYENISLAGFYWFAESVQDKVNDGVTLPAVAEKAAAKGTQIFWIPYFSASGYADWNGYGFATACMQPNYVFNTNTPTSQIYKAVELIRNFGMGIEIEIETPALMQEAFYKRYMKYLGYGIEAGYMKDCIHMYYQGHQVFYDACYADTELARNLYDTTYGFIKGTLTAPEKLEDFTVSCAAGKYVQGSLLDGVGDLNMAELTLSAEHGSVTVDAKGNYLYVPYEGFTGEDSFTFHYTNFLTWSEETTVTVRVG